MNNTSVKLCPCGSHRAYRHCCEPYLLGQSIPDTPEALMRSRYTAYSQANMEYIQNTMRSPALTGFNATESGLWASQVEWLGLKVLSAPKVSPKSNVGFVEFIATFTQQNRRQQIHERSEFHRFEGRWFYVDGTHY